MNKQIIERFINYHISLKALKEQLSLLSKRIVDCDNELSECRARASASEEVIRILEYEIRYLKLENLILQDRIERFRNENPEGYRCRYCRSIKLRRTGGEPHKVSGDKGIVDTFFICLDCGLESVVTINTLR
jgi:hypothetical protein